MSGETLREPVASLRGSRRARRYDVDLRREARARTSGASIGTSGAGAESRLVGEYRLKE